MMKKQKKQQPQPFEFPMQLLNQINECSNGGFALFTFDEEGTPSIFCNFDNQKDAYALQKHIRLWIEGMDFVNQQMAISNITDSFEDPPEEDTSKKA